jgi:hypothetical protein
VSVFHVKSVTIPDSTNTDIVRPSDYNSGHNQFLTISGNTLGASTVSGTNIVWAGTNNISLSINGATVSISGPNLTFRASNDAVGLNTAQTNVTWTVNSAGISLNAGGYAGTGFTSTTTVGTAVVGTHNTAGLSLGVPAYITTARGSTDAVGLATAQTNVTWTVNSNGLSLNAGGYAGTGFTSTSTAGSDIKATNNTAGLSMAVPLYLTTARGSTDAVGLNTAQTNVTWTVNSAGISLNAAGYAGTGTTFNGGGVSGSMTVNSVGVQLSLSANAGTVNQTGPNIGVSTGGNTLGSTGTVSTGNVVFVGGNNITLSQSTGGAGSNATITIIGNGGGIGAGVSTGGNTAGSTGTVTTGNVVFVGSSGITLSQSTGAAGSNATITIIGIGNKETISSWQYPAEINSSSAMAGQSVSMAAAFQMPQDGSFSFIRLPASMSTNSTTIATVATANANMSAELYSTWNAVVYSMGTGASSKSLISVVSGSGGFTFRNSISITNSTQYSVTQGFSAQAQGAGTTLTTQYSISNTNWSLVSTAIQSAFSAARYIDIPFANSLTPGPYWLVFGFSTSSATNSASFAAGTQCNVRFTAVHGATQTNQVWGVMGSTNLTTGGLAGVGSFSTAGGGTTSAFDVSFISSNASHFIPIWHMLRSA